jgi:putative transposase
MAFKLMMSAQGKWQKLNGANRMPEIIKGIAFIDRTKKIQTAA